MTPGSDAAAWLRTAIAYDIRRRPKMTILCAWCEADKPSAERASGDDLSHGICQRHAEDVLAEVRCRRLAREEATLAAAPRLLAFVESYAEPATDLVAKLAELDAEADAILKEIER